MDNILDNGTVLPFGLLTEDHKALIAGFAKSHQNFGMRIGIVNASFPIGDDNNRSQLSNEYDVLCFEQTEDRGITTLLYKNCLSAEGLGSIADFFERTLRPKQNDKNPNGTADTKNQDGACVLLLCLDGMSEKAIIIGAFTHPDRASTLTSIGPRLEGEFNGVNIKVEEDGSTRLTFRGATDSQGEPKDSSQGDTTIHIEKDGSYQVDHKTIIQRLDKNGKASLTADDDISNTTKKNFKTTAQENIALMASKNFTSDSIDWTIKASGNATVTADQVKIEGKSMFSVKSAQVNIEGSGLVKIKGSQITLEGLVALGGSGGQPLLKLSAQILTIGNLGIPAIGQAISGFTAKVTGQ